MTAPGFVTEAMEGLDEWLSVFPIEHLDEDWAVPCQRKRHQGEQPAQWVVWSVKCCDRMLPYALWCTPCLNDAMQRMATYDRECPHCGRLFAPAATVVRLIEPLNGRTP